MLTYFGREDLFKSRAIAAAFPLLLTVIVAIAQTGSPTHVASSEYFEFHSDPWLNAHHFLYQWARAEERIGEGRSRVEVPERGEIGSLEEIDLELWLKALSFYRRAVAPLDHFDSAMLSQKIELLRPDGDLNAVPVEKIDGLSDALVAAMPVYLKYWWPKHDRVNRTWVRDVLEPLLSTEVEFAELTSRLFAARWPDVPRRVDVSAYANFGAGYTAMGHTVIYSTDSGNQQLYGFETLLHEVQHTREIAGEARKDLRLAFQTIGRPVPENVWHSIIFVTAGEFVREYAGRNHVDHEPYWMREGFSELPGWKAAVGAVNEFWLPAVHGDSGRREAFERLTQHYHRQDDD